MIKEKVIKKQMEYIEFPYLEKMNKSEYDLFKKEEDNWAVCDPGKRVLLYIKHKDGKRFRYSNKEHLQRTKRIKYRIIIQNYKDNTGIEKQLTSYNSKSCVYETYKSYIEKKNIVNCK